MADPIQAVRAGDEDLLIASFAGCAAPSFSTYFGGTLADRGKAIAADSAGNLYVTGFTKSAADFPLLDPLQPLHGGARDAFILKLGTANLDPVITSSPITAGAVGAPYSYDVEASDPDGDNLTYALTSAPAGMSIDPDSGLITWTPDSAGDVTVVARVEDGQGGSATQTFTISVIQPNQNPTITSSPVTGATVDVPYSYALTSAPLGMSIDAASGVIVWTPITGGDYAATVTVDDGNGGTDDQSFVINVTVPSGANPPGLDPVGDQTVMLGTKLELQLTASDADGDTLTFALSPVPLPAGMTLNAATGELTFKPQTAATYQLTVVATDGRFTDQETITVTVPPPIPGAPTSFAGRVMDANAMADDEDLPIVGAVVSILNTTVSDVTDANGDFTLADIPPGEVVFAIDTATA